MLSPHWRKLPRPILSHKVRYRGNAGRLCLGNSKDVGKSGTSWQLMKIPGPMETRDMLPESNIPQQRLDPAPKVARMRTRLALLGAVGVVALGGALTSSALLSANPAAADTP